MTVILVTHAAHRLGFADNIIVLNFEGQISEQGTYNHLKKHGIYVPSLVTTHKSEHQRFEIEEPMTSLDTYRSHAAADEEVVKAAEDASRKVGDWSTYLYYIQACGWMNTCGFLLGMVIFGVFKLLPGKSTFSKVNLNNLGAR